MKIIGIGVDIVENNRFKKLIKKKNLLIEFVVLRKFNISKRIIKKFRICLKDFLLKKHLLKL